MAQADRGGIDRTALRVAKRKRLDEAAQLAEKALQKYPNHFSIVYQSAMIYYVMLEERPARRALELFERACGLIEQNTDERISLILLQNRIAETYLILGKYDEALRRFQQNNHGGLNKPSSAIRWQPTCIARTRPCPIFRRRWAIA